MKFELQELPRRMRDEPVQVGDVYKAKGGGSTRYWVVMGLTARMAASLGLSSDGAVVSATSYSVTVFEARERVGVVANIEDLVLNIEWEDR